eukprot:11699473-Ditylum_brightwellii.AAC.1
MEGHKDNNNNLHLSPIKISPDFHVLYKVGPEWQKVHPRAVIPSPAPSLTIPSTPYFTLAGIFTATATTTEMDASNYSLDQLQKMKDRERLKFDWLNFMHTDTSIINNLFPAHNKFG